MARRRGFFAELQRQQRLAEQKQRRQQAAAVRAHNQAVRESERAQREHERAQVQLQRAREADRKEAEKRALDRYRETMRTKAEERTAYANDVNEQIDGLLAATLGVDDYVDLALLKRTAEHPPFAPGSLAEPVPEPEWAQYPPEPAFAPPADPTGLAKLGSKKKHQHAYNAAVHQWQTEHAQWSHQVTVDIPKQNEELQRTTIAAEEKRQADLENARREYEEACQERQAAVNEHNAEIDDFIYRLGQNDPAAIDEYVGIVLANSVYPDAFPVAHDYTFDGDLKELVVTVSIPAPSELPTVKTVKFVASTDELRESTISQKDQRLRYNAATSAVALRTLHEVFEADRSERIESIALSVVTNEIDPATGHRAEIPLAAVACDRTQFLGLNLAAVDPAAALAGLGASLSKNPFALAPIPPTTGLRQR